MSLALIAIACSGDASRRETEPVTTEKACALPDGSIAVRSQSELDAVCGCTRIEGDVSIDASAVRDLECLTSLREVTGALALSALPGSPSLDSLEGLSALRKVGTLSLTGLSVRDLRGLSQLRTAESVALARLASLETLAGLEGTLERFQLTQCDELTDLRGLRARIRDFWLEKNARLRTLDGFVGLPAVAGAMPTVRLESLPELESLDGLFRSDGPHLARLQLMRLPKLEQVDARSARELGALVVRGCTTLREIRGLERIETIGQLHLTGNTSLARLPSFDGLRSVVDLELIEMPMMHDLEPLSNVERVTRIAFTMMDGLVSLRGLERVFRSERILLEDLLALEDLEGLRGLQEVETLWIGGDDKLESLRGLTLTQAHELAVRYNDELTTLEGLEGLREVGTLDVSENPKLVSVRALRGISQANTVFARFNGQLPGCEVEWLSRQLPESTARDFGDNGPDGACSP